MADAPDSKSGSGNRVGVQVPPPASNHFDLSVAVEAIRTILASPSSGRLEVEPNARAVRRGVTLGAAALDDFSREA